MKNLFILGLSILFFSAFTTDVSKQVPSVQLTDMDGNKINTAEISNDGKPVIISFWATWCTPCKKELNTIAEVYDDWIDETGVKLVAVSVDNERSKSKVKPYVNGVGWDYDVLLDPNGDFQRAMGVNNVPHTFLINGEGNIVWSHNNYAPGDEEELYEELLKLTE